MKQETNPDMIDEYSLEERVAQIKFILKCYDPQVTVRLIGPEIIENFLHNFLGRTLSSLRHANQGPCIYCLVAALSEIFSPRLSTTR